MVSWWAKSNEWLQKMHYHFPEVVDASDRVSADLLSSFLHPALCGGGQPVSTSSTSLLATWLLGGFG